MFGPCLDGLGLLVDIDVQRYARHISLPQVGREGQILLNRSRVLVIGAGGLEVRFCSTLPLLELDILESLMMIESTCQTYNGKSSIQQQPLVNQK